MLCSFLLGILLLGLANGSYSTTQQEVWETRDLCLDAQHRYLYDELFLFMRDLEEIRLLQQTGLTELSTQLGKNGIAFCDAFAASVRKMHERLKLHIGLVQQKDADSYNNAIARGWFRTLARLEDEAKNRAKCEQYDARATKRHTGLLGEMRRCMEAQITRAKQRFMIEKFAE
jgi:hypothetical protein